MQCTIRVLVLGASIGLCAALFLHTTYVVTSLLLAGFIGYQFIALIRYVEQTNRELSRFFYAIEQADFSQTFIAGSQLGPSFEALQQALTHVLEAFRQTRAEKEAHLRYVETVVQHVGSGLIAFRPDGEVTLMNTEAKRLLERPQLRRIQALTTLSPTLAQTLLDLRPGQRALIKIEEAREPLQLAIHATAFRLQEQDYTLVSLQTQNRHLVICTQAIRPLYEILTTSFSHCVQPDW